MGRKADRALLWLESQIFLNVWDAGRCVHGLKTLWAQSRQKFSWSSVSVLLSLCYSCALFLISVSCSPEIFPFCSTVWKLRSREEKGQHHIGIKDRTRAGVSKFTTFHLLSLLHNRWSWVLSPTGYTCWRDWRWWSPPSTHARGIQTQAQSPLMMADMDTAFPLVYFGHSTFFLLSHQLFYLFWELKLHFIYDFPTTYFRQIVLIHKFYFVFITAKRIFLISLPYNGLCKLEEIYFLYINVYVQSEILETNVQCS